MAQCPKCKIDWLWDWEQDCYRYTNSNEVETIQLSCNEQGMELELIVFKCQCGSINSTIYNDPNRGSSLCNIKEWQNVDWELNENSWYENYKHKILTKKKILVIAERGYCPDLTKEQVFFENCNYTWEKALKIKWSGSTLNKLENILPLPFDVINILPPNNVCGSWDNIIAERISKQIRKYLTSQTEYCAVILLGRKVTKVLYQNSKLGAIKKVWNQNKKQFTKILCAYHTASRTNFWSKNNQSTKELINKIIN